MVHNVRPADTRSRRMRARERCPNRLTVAWGVHTRVPTPQRTRSSGRLAVLDGHDPLLAKQAQFVGYRRSPGVAAIGTSAGIGRRRCCCGQDGGQARSASPATDLRQASLRLASAALRHHCSARSACPRFLSRRPRLTIAFVFPASASVRKAGMDRDSCEGMVSVRLRVANSRIQSGTLSPVFAAVATLSFAAAMCEGLIVIDSSLMAAHSVAEGALHRLPRSTSYVLRR